MQRKRTERLAVAASLLIGALCVGWLLRTEPETVDETVPELVGPARIVGRLMDVDGRPGKDFTLRCIARRSGTLQEIEATVRSHEDGSFRIVHLSPGLKSVEFYRESPGRLELAVVEVSLEKGQKDDCGTVRPASSDGRASIVSGRVISQDGSPVGGRVSISCNGPPSFSGRVETTEQGTFEFVGAIPGLVQVIVEPESSEQSTFGTEDFELRPGQTKDLSIVLPQRQPVALVEIWWDTAIDRVAMSEVYLEDKNQVWSRPKSVRTKGETLVVTVVPGGLYRATLIGGGYVGQTDYFVVNADESIGIEASLEEAVEITGRILDASSETVPRGRLRRIFQQGVRSWRAVQTRPDGSFVLRCYRPGESGLFQIVANGYKLKQIEVTAGITDLGDIYLERK